MLRGHPYVYSASWKSKGKQAQLIFQGQERSHFVHLLVFSRITKAT